MSIDIEFRTSIGTGSSYPTGVFVSGNYAYVVRKYNSNLLIYDISSPTSPFLIGSIGTSLNNAFSVVVSGNYAYVASRNNSKLVVFDISTPSSPSYVTDVYVDSPTCVVSSGGYLYVTGGIGSLNGKLSIFDISTPSLPVLTGSTPAGSGGLEYPYFVCVNGNYAYVTNQSPSSAFSIFDVSVPSSPSLSGSISTGLNNPLGVAVSGNYAYIVNQAGSVSVYDISTPSSPSYITAISTGITGAGVGVFVSGSHLYVAGGGLVSFDISTPSLPVFEDSSIVGLSSPWGVFSVGNYIYVTSYNNDNFVIFEVESFNSSSSLSSLSISSSKSSSSIPSSFSSRSSLSSQSSSSESSSSESSFSSKSSSSLSSAAREIELAFDFCGVKDVKIEIFEPVFHVVTPANFNLTAIGQTGAIRHDEGNDAGEIPSEIYPPTPESLPFGFEEVRERQ